MSNVIIEFNGLPGTGKSSVAEVLKNMFEADGFRAVSGYNRYFWHRYTYPLMVIPYDFKLYRLIRSYSKTVDLTNRVIYLSDSIHYCRMYENIHKDNNIDVAIIDQGIIQNIVSLAPQGILPKSSLLLNIVERIKKKRISFIRVDCKANETLSLNRVLTRTSTKHFLENYPQKDILQILSIQKDNFDIVRSVFSDIMPEQKVISIDTSDSIEKNAKIIRNMVLFNQEEGV